MMKRTSLMQKSFDESDDLTYVLEQQCKQGTGDCTEERYKIIVLTVLPLILDRLRFISFLFCFLLGMLGGYLFTH